MKLKNMFSVLTIISISWMASNNAFADTLKQKEKIIEGSAVCEYFLLQDFNHAIEQYKKNNNPSTLKGAFGLFMLTTTWNLLALDEGANQNDIDQALNTLQKDKLPVDSKDTQGCAKEAGSAIKSMPEAQAKRYLERSAARFRDFARKNHFEIPAGFFDENH